VNFTLPARFTPRERASGNRWIGELGRNSRGGLDVVARRKICAPVGNRTAVVQPIAQSLY